MSRSRPPFVVAIGGFDPSCGAGVVADARSVEAMGAMPLAVVTSVTVQSGAGLRSWTAVPTSRVLAQLDELLGAIPVAAVKIGQVPTAASARALARRLGDASLPLVLDPVLRASGGGALVARGAAEAILRHLVPLASLVTVNLAEASQWTGRRVRSLDGMKRAARELEEAGAGAVLVKGGHLGGDPVDVLRWRGCDRELASARIPGTVHGSGCALASAIAVRLAFGDDLPAAVRAARRHVRDLLRRPVVVGARRLRRPAAN